MSEILHQPVMVSEVLQYLNPHPGAVVVDGTIGTAGHSLHILPRLVPDGRLIAIDRDSEALQIAQGRLIEFQPMVTLLHGNYRDISALLSQAHCARVDGLLLDLGMSSLQVGRDERGFSFTKEGPLDMRMDPSDGTTAAALVNQLSEDELSYLLESLGEERFAKRIAAQLVRERRVHPIETTMQLARLITHALPPDSRHGRLHAATRTFQALRMAVNDEVGSLQDVLSVLPNIIRPQGRVIILTFHSIEDRLVKHAFRKYVQEGKWRLLTPKPLSSRTEEIAQNPRARSAKLRVIERLSE